MKPQSVSGSLPRKPPTGSRRKAERSFLKAFRYRCSHTSCTATLLVLRHRIVPSPWIVCAEGSSLATSV